MAQRVHVPGYEVEELIGFGGAGEVWRARDLSSGETVAVKRLHARGGAAVQRLRREAAILAAVAGPHVIGVRAVVVDGDDAVLVLDHAGGGSLATVLAVRGRIEAPEVVTVLAPLASALAAAHARGLVHGDLTPANVLFSADGRPMLADFGVAHAVGLGPEVVHGTSGYVDPEVVAGAAVSTASDVYALGAIGYAALTGQPPGEGRPSLDSTTAPGAPLALRDAVEAAVAADALDRPDARTLAASILDASAAGPVVLVGGDRTPDVPLTRAVRAARPEAAAPNLLPVVDASPTGGSRLLGAVRRRLLVASVAAVVLSSAIAAGVVWGRQGHSPAVALPAASASPTSSPSATARAATASWTSVVQRLASTRARAFTQADPSVLAGVYLPGSPAYGVDASTVRSLAGRGLRARGFVITVEHVTLVHADGNSARLHVVDRLSGYTLVDATGAVEGRGTASSDATFTMLLRRTGSGWRVARLSAV